MPYGSAACFSDLPQLVVLGLVLIGTVPDRVQVPVSVGTPKDAVVLLRGDALRPDSLLVIHLLPIFGISVSGLIRRGVSHCYSY